MKSMLASMGVVLTFCAAPALSAEFPKTGKAEYDTYYVDNVLAKIDSGAGTGSIVDETGITRNVKGEGPFHDMSVRCLYHLSVAERYFSSTAAALKPTKMVTTYSQSSTTKTTP
jgi:hypothetical protein